MKEKNRQTDGVERMLRTWGADELARRFAAEAGAAPGPGSSRRRWVWPLCLSAAVAAAVVLAAGSLMLALSRPPVDGEQQAAVRAEIRSLGDRIDMLTGQLERTRGEWSAARASLAAAHRQSAAQMAELRKKLASQRTALASAATRMGELERTAATRADLLRQDRQVQQIGKDLERTKDLLAAGGKQSAATEAKLLELQGQLAARAAKADRLHEQNRRLQAAADSARDQLRTLAASHARLAEKLEALGRESGPAAPPADADDDRWATRLARGGREGGSLLLKQVNLVHDIAPKVFSLFSAVGEKDNAGEEE